MNCKTALITGASIGVGFAIAESLARTGYHVVMHGIESAESMREYHAQMERTDSLTPKAFGGYWGTAKVEVIERACGVEVWKRVRSADIVSPQFSI